MELLRITLSPNIFVDWFGQNNQAILEAMEMNGPKQGMSQDLESGFPILSIVKFWGRSIFSRETTIYSAYNHKHVLSYRYDIMSIYKVMGIILRLQNFYYMLEIYILRNDSQKYLGILRGNFLRVWVSQRHLDALLAKTVGLSLSSLAVSSPTASCTTSRKPTVRLRVRPRWPTSSKRSYPSWRS